MYSLLKTSETYFKEEFLLRIPGELFVFAICLSYKGLSSPRTRPVNRDHTGSLRVEISHSLSELNQADKDDDGL